MLENRAASTIGVEDRVKRARGVEVRAQQSGCAEGGL